MSRPRRLSLMRLPRRPQHVAGLIVLILLLAGLRLWQPGWFEQAPEPRPLEPGIYHIARVIDGDTFKIIDGNEKIRLTRRRHAGNSPSETSRRILGTGSHTVHQGFSCQRRGPLGVRRAVSRQIRSDSRLRLCRRADAERGVDPRRSGPGQVDVSIFHNDERPLSACRGRSQIGTAWHLVERLTASPPPALPCNSPAWQISTEKTAGKPAR